MAEILLWVALAAIGLAALLRVRSLLHPVAYPPSMTRFLEGALRRYFAGAAQTLERGGLAPGQRVLEIGPGGGYVSEEAVRRLGPGGHLVCLDLQIEMLRQVRARLGADPPACVQASGSVLPFRDGAFDHVFLVTVLGEIPDQAGALRECHRVLRPQGSLAVTESLPDPDYVRTPVLRRRATAAGFAPGPRLGSWLNYTHRFVRS